MPRDKTFELARGYQVKPMLVNDCAQECGVLAHDHGSEVELASCDELRLLLKRVM